MLAWTFLWPERDAADLAPSDAIVCLGGGMAPDGTLAPAVLTRIERCVELFNADHAPLIIFSGGMAAPNGPSAGDQMLRYAASLGVPPSAMLSEGAAQSTLQNALFTLPMIPQATQITIVTEGFHLPRSWASFKWAAWELPTPAAKITLVMSEPVRRHPDGAINWHILGRESLAIWFNAGRAVIYSGASIVGWAEEQRVDWLH